LDATSILRKIEAMIRVHRVSRIEQAIPFPDTRAPIADFAYPLSCSIQTSIVRRTSGTARASSIARARMTLLHQNIRHSLRRLRHSPGFALTAILTLAIAIGAVTSVFSVVNAVLLKPFAFRDPGRLVVMREVVDEWRSFQPIVPMNYMHYQRLKQQSQTIQDAAIFQGRGLSVALAGDHPHILGGLQVSPNFFSVLGVQPILGRDFLPAEATQGRSNVVILSYRGWQSLLNGDSSAIGRTLRIGGNPNTVIGVLPRGFRFPDVPMAPGMTTSRGQPSPGTEIFEPQVPSQWDLTDDVTDFNYSVVARLKPGVPLAAARAELDGLDRAHAIAIHSPFHDGIYVQRFSNDVTAGVSGALWLLFAAVLSVLLIACVNLANLQLARAISTERETAVRAALGASRGQLLVTRLTESLVIAAIGGFAGIWLAFIGVRLFVAAAPAGIPRIGTVHVSLQVLLFACALSILTALAFGILPALRMLRVDPQSALQSNPARVANTRQGSRTRSLLVVTEVAFTVALLIVTGLVVRSFSQVLRQDRGFDSGHLTLAQVDLYSPQFGDSNSSSLAFKAAFIDRALAQIAAIPGVSSAGITSVLPLTGQTWIDALSRPDHPLPDSRKPLVNVRWISPGYLATMRTPLVSGRDLSPSDRSNPNVALISEQAARDGFPGESPIGRKIASISPYAGHSLTIIGVVADSRVNGLKDTSAMLYMPYWVSPPWQVAIVVRSGQPTAALAPQIRRILWNLDPQVPIPILKSMDDQINESIASERFQTLLLSSFGAAALLLALLGVYGVLAYGVSLRRQEFGIRIALGSNKGRLIALVLRQAVWPVLAGAGAGLLLAFVATRWVRGLLYQTSTADPVAIAASLALLLAAALLAAILPARRAAATDPMQVLRNE
jgi:predicted permease